MEVHPSSPELNSQNYYACGVDVCEEGIQFCNIGERRCEYCVDYHQDCFTYAQQQNCTQYCQDQWKKNQSEICSSCEPTTCEDIYKSLFGITSILFLITFIILLLHVKKIRSVLVSVISLFVPSQLLRIVRQIFKKNARKDDRDQNSETPGLGRTSTEDIEGAQNEENSAKIEIQKLTKESPSRKHDTSRKDVFETASSHNLSRQNRNKDNSSVTQQVTPAVSDISQSKSEGKVPASLVGVPCNFNDRGPRETNGRATLAGTNLDNAPIKLGEIIGESLQSNEETQLLKHYSEPSQTRVSGDIPVAGTSQEQLYALPHGELSTMSSRGGYRAMLPNSNQSTDNGYVTAIGNRCTNS